ncbi:MAG: exodeoxyribonuclease III [Bdellovibrionota bacterium]
MSATTFFTWNVNGIRACHRQGFVSTLEEYKPDIVGLQEVRATQEQIPEDIQNHKIYPHQFYFGAQKKGYSGVGILSKKEPENVLKGIGAKEFDFEGRSITAIFPKFIYCSTYFPNSQDKGKRIAFKLEFCIALNEWLMKLSKKHPDKALILAGDFNIAHEEIDLARPNDNHDSPGFLPDERAWMSKFLDSGWTDSFRTLHKETVKYSWWSARTRARDRNIGWRIDYHTLYNTDLKKIKKAEIYDQVFGSDHCPVTLSLDL